MDMKLDYGLYQIINTRTGQRYIGATRNNFHQRFYMHRWSLNRGAEEDAAVKSANTPLQEDWNTFGEESFEFQVLEAGPRNLSKQERKAWCNANESKYIDPFIETDKLYNLRKGGTKGSFSKKATKSWRSSRSPGKGTPLIWTDQKGKEFYFESQIEAARFFNITRIALSRAVERGGWGSANRTPRHRRNTTLVVA